MTYLLIGLIFTITLPLFVSRPLISCLIPFVIQGIETKNTFPALWRGFLTGLFLDLLSVDTRFGLYGLTYLITTFLALRLKGLLFEDHRSTLSTLTFLFSSLSQIVRWGLIPLLDKTPLSLSAELIFTSLLLVPLYNALFAFTMFTLPAFLFQKPERKAHEYFLN